jgi:hypothetical protein
MRNAPVLLAEKRDGGRRRAGGIGRPQRVCADRTHLDEGKMNWVKLEDGLPQYPETVPL